MRLEQKIEVRRLKTVDELLDNWPFFAEGLQTFNAMLPEEQRISSQELFRVASHAVTLGPQAGHVALYLYEGRPRGYSITLECSPLFCKRRTALVYMAFGKPTVTGGSRFVLNHIEKWARSAGFEELQAFSPRINGSGFALFEKRFKFKRFLVCFYKLLT